MKRMIACGAALCFILICFSAEQAQSRIADSVIRLHIIANSDSEEDQTLKLSVRDFVLARYGEELKAVSRKDALEKIYDLLPQILREVSDFCGQKVSVSVGESAFPTKQYGSFSLPKGNYLALKIILGEGKGKNWWCVMYPPLCFEGAAKVTNREKLKEILTKDEYNLICAKKGTVFYKFKAVELWESLKTK